MRTDAVELLRTVRNSGQFKTPQEGGDEWKMIAQDLFVDALHEGFTIEEVLAAGLESVRGSACVGDQWAVLLCLSLALDDEWEGIQEVALRKLYATSVGTGGAEGFVLTTCPWGEKWMRMRPQSTREKAFIEGARLLAPYSDGRRQQIAWMSNGKGIPETLIARWNGNEHEWE